VYGPVRTVVWEGWRREASPYPDATPYLYIYDLPVLAIPLAFLLRLGFADGFLPFEWPAIAAACGLVLAFLALAMPDRVRRRRHCRRLRRAPRDRGA
jgi:hypothetical protein